MSIDYYDTKCPKCGGVIDARIECHGSDDPERWGSTEETDGRCAKCGWGFCTKSETIFFQPKHDDLEPWPIDAFDPNDQIEPWNYWQHIREWEDFFDEEEAAMYRQLEAEEQTGGAA